MLFHAFELAFNQIPIHSWRKIPYSVPSMPVWIVETDTDFVAAVSLSRLLSLPSSDRAYEQKLSEKVCSDEHKWMH